MAKRPLKSGRLRWFFLSCIIVLLVASVVALVAVLLYVFNVADTETAFIILCISLSVAVVAGVLSMLMGRMVLKPLKRLSEASRPIAAGDFDLNLTYEGKISEFRDTYDSFNVMARELSAIETLRSDFIANVSHEFKTPLSTIEGYAMLLQDAELSADERADGAQRILDNAGRLSALVTDILAEYDIGLTLVDVKIQDAEPPTQEVIEAFKAVETAKQQAETVVNDAKAYQNAQLPLAKAEADKLIQNAEYLKQKRINEAVEQVAMFNAMYEEYAKNPQITKSRMYYEAIQEILPGVKLFINTSTSGDDVQMLLPLESLVDTASEGGNE
jgi:signal transduction histidine kinase